MSKKDEHKKVVPELRFSEFEKGSLQDSYKKYLFTDIFNFSTGKNIKQREASPNFKIPCVRYGELYHMYNEVIYQVINRTNLDKSELRFSKGNEILIPSAGEDPLDIGSASALTIENVAIGRTINILSPIKENTYSQIYVSYYINEKFRRKISTLAKGSSISNVYNSDLKKLEILLPSLPEQQKIANTLTTLDDLIGAEDEKLNTLKTHKKGLLQQLFPAKGEKVPELRFGEFRGKWSMTTISDNCLVKGRIGYRGYTKKDLVEKGKGALVIGGKHIQNHKLDLSDPTFLSWEKYYESPEIMVEINHIIFSQRGSLGDCVLIERNIGKATINPSMVLLKEITCDAKFLYFVLIGNTIQKAVERVSSSSAVPMLSQKQIKEFPFYIPSLEEQQKIANCLSSLDDLIITQTKKIELLKEHKKGLMQQMFPNVNKN